MRRVAGSGGRMKQEPRAMDEWNESALLMRCQQGDRDSFDPIVSRYMRQATGFALGWTGNRRLIGSGAGSSVIEPSDDLIYADNGLVLVTGPVTVGVSGFTVDGRGMVHPPRARLGHSVWSPRGQALSDVSGVEYGGPVRRRTGTGATNFAWSLHSRRSSRCGL